MITEDYKEKQNEQKIEQKSTWKPNMAQINALYAAIKQVDAGNAVVLKGLYNKLIAL